MWSMLGVGTPPPTVFKHATGWWKPFKENICIFANFEVNHRGNPGNKCRNTGKVMFFVSMIS